MNRTVFVRGVLGAVLLVSLVATPASAAPTGTAARTAPTGSIPGSVLQQLLDAERDAGMLGLFAEVRDGRERWAGASGVAFVETGKPPQPWYRHRVGSITKTFVATTVLQLVGEGRVRLDAPVGDYLPDVVPGPVGREVTVRMLLNHTSGIGNYTDEIFSTVEKVVEAATTTFAPRDLVAIGLAMPPTNAPGAAWSYSNTNYIVLGLLIERITGRPYAAEVERRILRPLELRGTYFPGTDPTIRGPHAGAYVPWTEDSYRDFSVYNMSWAWAAGELISTPQDLNRFYRALLTGKLLRPALLAEMKTTVPVYPDAQDAFGYGLGIYWVRLPCGQVWGHDGGVIGHATISWHSEDGSRQVTLAENLRYYGDPNVPHPIDTARMNFLTAALCGTEAAGTLAADAAGTLRLPPTADLPAFPGR